MKNVQVLLNETNCRIIRDQATVFSCENNFYSCQDVLLQQIKAENSSITLILDHFWIKQFRFHIEDTKLDQAMPLILAQVADQANLPEALIECRIIDTIQKNDSVQGTALYTDKQELQQLKAAFNKAGLVLDSIYHPEFPQHVFYDRASILSARSSWQKKLFAICTTLLLLNLSCFFWNGHLTDRLNDLAQLKVRHLQLKKEHDVLRTIKAFRLEGAQYLKAAEEQRALLKEFFGRFPGTLRPGIHPLQLDLDLAAGSLSVKGSCPDTVKRDVFARALTALPFIKEAFLEKTERSGESFNFELKAAL